MKPPKLLTPYQQQLLDAQTVLVRGLAAQDLRQGAIATLLSHHADICQLLQQYQVRLREAYTQQQLVEFGPQEEATLTLDLAPEVLAWGEQGREPRCADKKGEAHGC